MEPLCSLLQRRYHVNLQRRQKTGQLHSPHPPDPGSLRALPFVWATSKDSTRSSANSSRSGSSHTAKAPLPGCGHSPTRSRGGRVCTRVSGSRARRGERITPSAGSWEQPDNTSHAQLFSVPKEGKNLLSPCPAHRDAKALSKISARYRGASPAHTGATSGGKRVIFR